MFKYYGKNNLPDFSNLMQSFLPEIKVKDKAIDLSNSPSRRKKLQLEKAVIEKPVLEFELNSPEEEHAVSVCKGLHECFKIMQTDPEFRKESF